MSNYQLFQNDLPSQSLKSFKGSISIDTETLGLNIKRDRLCLIQLKNEHNRKFILFNLTAIYHLRIQKILKLFLKINL